MTRRGRPALNLSPAERKIHRRAQLLESQRRRRAKLRERRQQHRQQDRPQNNLPSQHTETVDLHEEVQWVDFTTTQLSHNPEPQQIYTSPCYDWTCDDWTCDNWTWSLDPATFSSTASVSFDPSSLVQTYDLLGIDGTFDASTPSLKNTPLEGGFYNDNDVCDTYRDFYDTYSGVYDTYSGVCDMRPVEREFLSEHMSGVMVSNVDNHDRNYNHNHNRTHNRTHNYNHNSQILQRDGMKWTDFTYYQGETELTQETRVDYLYMYGLCTDIEHSAPLDTLQAHQ